jgi:TonB family protein
MVTYFIKSTVCLFLLYGFFHIFLRNHKTLLFNRFFLIFSLVFSLIIPLIDIQVRSNFPLNNSFNKLFFNSEKYVQHSGTIDSTTSFLTYQNLILLFYISISLVLLIRFVLNILKLYNKIRTSYTINDCNTTLILVEENILPYSFFRFIFVNRADFESRKIEKEFLIHEEAHCSQYHSVDIILIELINIFHWFNPAIWLYRNAILRNHEFYADKKVLAKSDSFDYQQLLLNILLQNNTNYLVSNFKYSLIKSRLIMMSTNEPSKSAILRNTTACILILILGSAFTLSNSPNLNNNATESENAYVPNLPLNSEANNVTGSEFGIAKSSESKIGLSGSSIEMPQFPGGDIEAMRWISKNTIYPKEAIARKIVGKVEVSFTVTSKGKIKNVRANNPVDPFLDTEAIRIISSMPDWKPAIRSGLPVEAEMMLPITFSIK